MKRLNRAKSTTFLLGLLLVAGSEMSFSAPESDNIMTVDTVQSSCLLPGQVRKLSAGLLYVSQRQAVTIDSKECRDRGGEIFSLSDKK